MNNNKLILVAVTISSLFSCVYIFTNRTPELFPFGGELMDFFYSLSVSTIAAGIFYLFQVFLPERKRLKILKKNFGLNYLNFKNDCTDMFLSEIGESSDIQLLSRLSNQKEFKSYFKEDYEKGQTKWDGVINGLNHDEATRKELRIQFEIFSEEVNFFLNNVSVQDEDVFNFLKRLKIGTHNLKYMVEDDDGAKTLSAFVWELFAGWSFITGYRDDDIIDYMIGKA